MREKVAFELERFRWATETRLEIAGRWEGLRGRRLAQPFLIVQAGGVTHRLPGLPGGQLGGDPAVSWKASFAWDGDPVEVIAAELEVGRNIVVELPPPRSRRSRLATTGAAEAAEAAEAASLREQLAALRAELAELRAAPAEPPERAAPAPQAAAELEHLREQHERLRSEHDALADRHAVLLTRSGELRGELAEADEARRGHAAELRTRQEDLQAAQAQLQAARAQGENTADQLAASATDRERLVEELNRLRGELTAGEAELERLKSRPVADTVPDPPVPAVAPPPAEDPTTTDEAPLPRPAVMRVAPSERSTARRPVPPRAVSSAQAPDTRHATTRVWLARVAAVALVTLLLFALVIIVSALT